VLEQILREGVKSGGFRPDLDVPVVSYGRPSSPRTRAHGPADAGRGDSVLCPVSRTGVADLGWRGVVPTAKDSVEIGQITEADVVGDITDSARRALRVSEHAQRTVQPVLQNDCV